MSNTNAIPVVQSLMELHMSAFTESPFKMDRAVRQRLHPVDAFNTFWGNPNAGRWEHNNIVSESRYGVPLAASTTHHPAIIRCVWRGKNLVITSR